MTFVSLAAIEVDYGTIADTAERAKATVLIERAEDRIRQDCGSTVEQLVDAGTTFPSLAQQAVSEMVLAVLRNPECNVSSSESIGGLAESRTLNLAAASGLLRLSDDQRSLLGIDAASRGGGAFTIAPGGLGMPQRVLDTFGG